MAGAGGSHQETHSLGSISFFVWLVWDVLCYTFIFILGFPLFILGICIALGLGSISIGGKGGESREGLGWAGYHVMTDWGQGKGNA